MKYICSVCGLEKYSEDKTEIPMCCRTKMEPLEPCMKVQDAEMAKFTDEDGPCDDCRGQNE